MTKRLIAIVLTVTTVGGAQGLLLRAAAAPLPGPPPLAAADDGGAAGHRAPPAFAPSVLPDAAGSASIACLRGGDACFDWGSWDCCGEFFVLLAVASASGAWVGAAVAAWAYWYYCLEYET